MPVFNRNELPENAKVYERFCDKCNRHFYTTKPKTKYCSNTCRTYAYYDNNPDREKKDKPKTKSDLEKELEALKIEFENYKKKSIYFRSGLMTQEIQKIYERVQGHIYEYREDIGEVKKDVALTAIAQYLLAKRWNDGRFHDYVSAKVREIKNGWYLGDD